jgi:hypothetical protein
MFYLFFCITLEKSEVRTWFISLPGWCITPVKFCVEEKILGHPKKIIDLFSYNICNCNIN